MHPLFRADSKFLPLERFVMYVLSDGGSPDGSGYYPLVTEHVAEIVGLTTSDVELIIAALVKGGAIRVVEYDGRRCYVHLGPDGEHVKQ